MASTPKRPPDARCYVEMSLADVVQILAILAAIGTMVIIWRQQERRSSELAYLQIDAEHRRASEQIAESARLLVEIERLQTLVATLGKDSSTEIAEAVVRGMGQPSRDGAPMALGDHRIVSELAHSLKTPLAHLEATLTGLAFEPTNSNGELREALEEMGASVDLCKATLGAFRELTRVAKQAEDWSPESLARSAESAYAVYTAVRDRDTTWQSNLPDEVAGYSNNFLLAALLPLIENAVEASPDEESIRVSYREDPHLEVVEITISNAVTVPADLEIFHTVGRTSKIGHDGLGVAVASDLVRAYDGELIPESRQGEFSVTVRIPRRRVGE